jgi:hypothetical protein
MKATVLTTESPMPVDLTQLRDIHFELRVPKKDITVINVLDDLVDE